MRTATARQLQQDYLASLGLPDFDREITLRLASDVPGSMTGDLVSQFVLQPISAIRHRWAGGDARAIRDHLITVLHDLGLTRARLTSLSPADVRVVGRTWRVGEVALRPRPTPSTCECCCLARWLVVLDAFEPGGGRSQYGAEQAASDLRVDTHVCLSAAALQNWQDAPTLLPVIDRHGTLGLDALSPRSMTAAMSRRRELQEDRPVRRVNHAVLPVHRRPPPDRDLPDLLDRLEEMVDALLHSSSATLDA